MSISKAEYFRKIEKLQSILDERKSTKERNSFIPEKAVPKLWHFFWRLGFYPKPPIYRSTVLTLFLLLVYINLWFHFGVFVIRLLLGNMAAKVSVNNLGIIVIFLVAAVHFFRISKKLKSEIGVSWEEL